MLTSVIYFGGRYRDNGWTQNDIVAEFKNDIWYKLGDMAEPRSYHRSIQMNDKIFIFGGSLKYDCFNFQHN